MSFIYEFSEEEDFKSSFFSSALIDILDIVVQHVSFGDGTCFFFLVRNDFATTNQRGGAIDFRSSCAISIIIPLFDKIPVC